MAFKGRFLISRYNASSVPNISDISGTTFGPGVAPCAFFDINHPFIAVRTRILTIFLIIGSSVAYQLGLSPLP